MLEIPVLPANPVQKPHEGDGGGVVPVSDDFKAEHGEESDRNFAANRWPRQETMALLNIRSEMDAAFRDATPKAPLWEQVSRKLAELGYERSAKKCREKFENIYKYHRRTKEGRFNRTNSSNSKTYRFFDQLEALNTQTVTKSTTPSDNNVNNNYVIQDAVPCSVRFPSGSATTSSSSSGEGDFRKKKKLSQFFEGLMMGVMERQETLQRKLMETLDKSERDRMAREEAWKVEELARIQKERELLAQERSIAAAKDEAVLAFLKKITENTVQVQLPENIIQVYNEMQEENAIAIANGEIGEGDSSEKQEFGSGSVNGNGNGNVGNLSSSRWPRDEVEALIRLRTEMDIHVHVHSQGSNSNSNTKGSLWEDISSAMKKIGYDRSAKRCKEKWENINKYFKRMKEKNKRKPMDSKTCPYYHHLEALYSKRSKKEDELGPNSSVSELKPEELLMHIMESQQQQQNQENQEEREKFIESESDDVERENTDIQKQGDNDNEDQNGLFNTN